MINFKPLRSASNPPTSYQGLSDSQTFFCRFFLPCRAKRAYKGEEAKVTPEGIFLPAYDELCIFGVTSKLTSDCLIDRLGEWCEMVRLRFAHITTLMINLDTGPENQSRRTQFLRRIVEFAQFYGLNVRLA